MAANRSIATSMKAFMGRRVLVDTSYLVALLEARDNLHERARALSMSLDDPAIGLVTSDAILLEFANFFSATPLRTRAATWIAALRAAGTWECVPLERPLLLRAEKRYASHADKNWSLTDCHSMELMRDRRLRQIATADQGFEQAGFECLLTGSG